MKKVRHHFQLFDTSEDRDVRDAFLSKWREELKGQRAFVIGNGPSLSPGDLDLIQGEVSLASNLIHLIYPQTSWRPTFVSITDPLVWQKFWHRKPAIVSPLLADTRFSRPPCPVDIIRFPQVPIFSNERLALRHKGKPFTSDLSRGYFGGFTVTYFNLQLAIWLGLNPIYLLGVDHKYGEGEASAWLPRQRSAENKISHFHSEYRREGEVVKTAPLQGMERFYRTASQVAKNLEIEIVNLTPNSMLRAFKRGELKKVLENRA